MIYKGKKEIDEIFRGKYTIGKVYHGKQLVWELATSCFDKGYWINNLPWNNDLGWRN